MPIIDQPRYMFVDGGYLQARAKEFGENWFEEAAQIDYRALSAGFQKTFYYDSLPARKDSEIIEDYQRRIQPNVEFFDSLRALSGWHVNEGLTKRGRKSGARQKEVDILIAVDMLTHAHRKNMSRVAFIAGDQDFRPLVEAIVREGIYVELWFDARSISADLKNIVDAWYELELYRFHGFLTEDFKKRHPLPRFYFNGDEDPPQNMHVIETGISQDSTNVEIFAMSNGEPKYHLRSTERNERSHFLNGLYSGDLNFLKRVYTYKFGNIDWKTN